MNINTICRYAVGTLAFAVTAWGFVGCGLYTAYRRPETPFVDSLYRSADTLVSRSNSLASLTWRELFADTLLQNLIRRGLDNNTDLRVARLRVAEAEAALDVSRKALFPSVSAGASVGWSADPSRLNYSVAPSFAWEADIFGRLTNAKRSAAAALESSEAYRNAVQTQLIATIANSYYTLLMLDEQLEISRRTLDTWEESIRSLEALKRGGKTNEAAVLQAKANRLSVEGSALTLVKQIREQEYSLAALLGSAPFEIERGSLGSQSFPKELSIGLPLQLLDRRPDVRQAEMELAQACYAVNIARASFYPAVTLSGTLGWSGAAGAAIANPGSWLLNALLQLTQPIFAQGRNKANLKTAQARQEQALLKFRQSLLDAGTEVNMALIGWQTALKRLDVDKKQILNLRGAVWNTRLLMRHSTNTNYLEVLTAQQNLLQAELTEITDRYNEIQSIISLYRALGGGAE